MPAVLLQSTDNITPSCAFHALGLDDGCSGFITSDLPLVYSTCVLSGDQQAAYTGITVYSM